LSYRRFCEAAGNAKKPPQGAKESSHGRKPVDKEAPKIQEAPAGGDAYALT